MSLLSSLSTGTTGLDAASQDLTVIGNNIANANTVGYKADRVDFADTLSQSLVGDVGQVGLGTRVEKIQKVFTQGALSTTGLATDLALQGSGFFEVAGTTNDGRQGVFLTRAGQFTSDNDGFLVNVDGLRVQGYQADATGNLTSVLGDLEVGNQVAPPLSTREITVKANLAADAPITVWDPANPGTTSAFATSTTIYDSLGKASQVSIYFAKDGAGQWEWHAMTDGANVTGGTAGTLSEIASGTLAFDTNGVLIDQNQTSDFNPIDATQGQVLDFNMGTPLVPGGTGTGLDGVTNFAGTSAATFIGQDGYASGTVSSVQIDKNGIVNGVFTNGQTRVLGQVAVATVAAQDALEKVGGNLYASTRASGDIVSGVAGTGGRAFISSGTLEQSNVDIADQFVKMIAAQRAFEANSKTITTADSLLNELIQMKR